MLEVSRKGLALEEPWRSADYSEALWAIPVFVAVVLMLIQLLRRTATRPFLNDRGDTSGKEMMRSEWLDHAAHAWSESRESIPDAGRVPTVRQLEKVMTDWGFGALERVSTEELEDVVQHIRKQPIKRGLTPEQQHRKDAVITRQEERLRQRRQTQGASATLVDGDGESSPTRLPRTFSGEVAYEKNTSVRAHIRQMMRSTRR